MIADSGNIVDDGADSLKGGRLGVYCDSQEQIIWSALSYRFLQESIINQNESISNAFSGVTQIFLRIFSKTSLMY